MKQKFLWNFLAFSDPVDVGNFTSGSSALSKSSLNIWKFLVYILLKPWRILSITLLACEMSTVVQYFEHCLVFPFFGIETKLTFSSTVVTALFSKFAGILSAALSQHHLLGFEIAGIPSLPLDLFVVMLPKAHFTSHSRMSGSR